MYLMNSIFITFSLDICQFQNIAEMCWTYNIWIKGDKETLNKIIKIKKGQIDKNKRLAINKTKTISYLVNWTQIKLN